MLKQSNDQIDTPSGDTLRDARKSRFYITDNIIIDYYITMPIAVEVKGKQQTRTLGAPGLGVYNVLTRYANKEKRSWPGIRLIAQILGLAPNTVMTYLALLEKANLIRVIRTTDANGQHMHNEYILLDVVPQGGGVSTSDTPLPEGGVSTIATRVYQPSRHGCINHRDTGVSTIATEQYLINNTYSTKPNNKTSSSSGPMCLNADEDDDELSPEQALACNLLTVWLANETGYGLTPIRVAIASALRAGRDPYEIETAIRGWLAHCKRRDGIKVPGALIIKRVQAGQIAPAEDRRSAETERLISGRRSVLDPESEEDTPDDPADEPEPQVEVIIPSRNGNDHVWELALSQLRLQMRRSTWESWLRDATGHRDGDTLTIALANQYAYDWVSQRLGKTVERTVRAVDPAITTIAYTIA